MDAHIIYSPEFQESIDISKKIFQAASNNLFTPYLYTGVSAYNALEVISNLNIKQDKTWLTDGRTKGSIQYRQFQLDSSSVQGCFLSHFQLWQKCVELNKPISILEHDGLIIRQMPNLDWVDILDLSFDREDIDGKYGINQYSPDIHLKGAYAYAIKPHAAQILVDSALSTGFRPADVFISSCGLTIEYIKPQIAILDQSYELSLTHDVGLWYE